MNKILKLTFVLFLICAIVAGVLGGVNELTKDRIYAIQNAATIAAYSAVLEAEGYDPTLCFGRDRILDISSHSSRFNATPSAAASPSSSTPRPPVWVPMPPPIPRSAGTSVPSSWARARTSRSPSPAVTLMLWPVPPSPPTR